MELRLLGPVELWHQGRHISLGTPRQRCVLAVLALTPGQPVPLQTLANRVWDDELPGNVRDVLYSYVSRLRGLLGQASAADGRTALHRHSGGYVLDVAADTVDVHLARRLASEARAAAGDRGPGDEQAADLLREAVRRWRGAPLAGVPGDWADRVRDALSAERLTLLTDYFRAELRLGRHDEAVGPLGEILADAPLAEPVAELLMVAMYRSRRQFDALQVYARTRRHFIETLGDEPGLALSALHEAILRRDSSLGDTHSRAREHPSGIALNHQASPALDAETVQLLGREAEPAPPAQLPPDVAAFTGRDWYLRQLDALLSDAEREWYTAVAAIEGAAGIGKTALAVHWAQQVRDRFADGQLYVDLRGRFGSRSLQPIHALGGILRALGVAADEIPGEVDEATAMYRSLLADKRMLIVLDDAAATKQVRPLLPGGRGCVALVTSRDRLTGLVARDGARRLALEPFTIEEAASLLACLLEGGQEPTAPEALAQLARRCGYMPLDLRCAAADLIIK